MPRRETCDRVFVPFNFTTVSPFDALAVALAELPTPYIREPLAPADSHADHAFEAPGPSRSVQDEVLRLLCETADEGNWTGLLSNVALSCDAASSSSRVRGSQWVAPLCSQLSIKLQHQEKRSASPVHPVAKRATPKRPRRGSVGTGMRITEAPTPTSPTETSVRTQAKSYDQYEISERQSQKQRATGITYARELRMQEIAQNVDLDEFTAFTTYLEHFVLKSRKQGTSSTGEKRTHMLRVASNLSVLCELRDRVVLFSSRGAIRHVQLSLLSALIAILETRIWASIEQCATIPETEVIAESFINEAVLGITAASIVLIILCAPDSPRGLLVEELLDSIVRVLRTVSTFVVYPTRDPLYLSSRLASGVREKISTSNEDRSMRSAGRHQLNADERGVKRANLSKRRAGKADDALVEACCALYDSLTTLFLTEQHLPDSIVSQSSRVCISCLSVTGLPRLQLHSMKTVAAIFSSYMSHRLAILDEAREAACFLPANRRHLRSYRVPGEDFEVRVTSALLAQLLCSASTDSDKLESHEENTDGKMIESYSWVALSRKRHDRAAKMAAHMLEPLLTRSYTDRDSDFRTAFQALFEDILGLYGKPEWPSAELMLQTLSVAIITRSRDQVDKSILFRSTSVDVLGALAARMCSLYGNQILSENPLASSSVDLETSLEQDRDQILLYLDPDKSPHFAAAASFYKALFVTDDENFALSMRRCSRRGAANLGNLSSHSEEDVRNSQDMTVDADDYVHAVVEKNAAERSNRLARKKLCKESISRLTALKAARHVGLKRSFAGGFRTILDAILDGMHDSAPTVRAKAIRALSVVDESSSGILAVMPTVITSIEASCRDVSTLARDAALDLLSRFLLPTTDTKTEGIGFLPSSSDDVALPTAYEGRHMFEKVFGIVVKRLADLAISVRKRAIGILRSVLADALRQHDIVKDGMIRSIECPDEVKIYERRIISICTSIVPRLDDPESSVRDSAERTLRLGLLGCEKLTSAHCLAPPSAEIACVLAERLVTFCANQPYRRHTSIMHRIIHRNTVTKQRLLLSAIVAACVDQLHDYEASLANLVAGRRAKDIPHSEQKVINGLSVRRAACSSLLCAFADLNPSLIASHCRALAPSIKGIHGGGVSESDLHCAQRILKILEIGIGRSGELNSSFLEEVMHDVELIVCRFPTYALEEASVRCLCVVVKIAQTLTADELLRTVALNFMGFLQEKRVPLVEYCFSCTSDKPSGLLRNARGALVRLGLLARFGDFEPSFLLKVFEVLELCCRAFCVESRTDVLAKASLSSLSHFLIRRRSFLTRGSEILLSAMDLYTLVQPTQGESSSTSAEYKSDAINNFSPTRTAEGIQVCVLQGFHELLRDEEERNSLSKEFPSTAPTPSRKRGDESSDSGVGISSSVIIEDNAKKNPDVDAAKPILAAEEDAEAGYLALTAQAMLPRLKSTVHSDSTAVRRIVANVLGLLVRQGLVLPATVVTSLFTLLLDNDPRCREHSFRVISFLADRHSGMLASAALPALRLCFESSLSANYVSTGFSSGVDCRGSPNPSSGVFVQSIPSREAGLTVEQISRISVDPKTGYSLLSQALMAMRRDQRRGVLESLVREFDPRVSVRFASRPENSNETRVHEDIVNSACDVDPLTVHEPSLQAPVEVRDADDDDDVGEVNGADMDLEFPENLCPLSTLYFLSITLATVDYTNGAGVGGSLTQGGGTAAADLKMKLAKEDVSDLIGVATRIISNSGQAALRVAKQVFGQRNLNAEKVERLAHCASRISLLLSLKHHLKVARWRPRVEADEDCKDEWEVLLSATMPPFSPDQKGLEFLASLGSSDRKHRYTLAEGLLTSFQKLMRDDAIDDRDLGVSSRRIRGTSGRRKAGSAASGMKRTRRKGRTSATPAIQRQKSRRASSGKASRRLRYGGSSEEDASEFDPNTMS